MIAVSLFYFAGNRLTADFLVRAIPEKLESREK
jgi:hypothetical protein